jgi:hypothetical protein
MEGKKERKKQEREKLKHTSSSAVAKRGREEKESICCAYVSAV